jgi:DNA-binding NarL/FixJ family response regulator
LISEPGTDSRLEPQSRVDRRCRVVIAEDHPIMREGLTDLLEQEPAVTLVGWADCTRDAERLIRTRNPQLLVLDLTLGNDDGIEFARRLRAECPELQILVLSMHDELVFADQLLAMGARAYLTKDRTRSEFLAAVRAVMAGETYLTDAQRERQHLRLSGEAEVSPEHLLSARELAVLRLLARGKTCTAIAADLGVASKTIYSHRRNIALKLGIDSGRGIVRYAINWARNAA